MIGIPEGGLGIPREVGISILLPPDTHPPPPALTSSGSHESRYSTGTGKRVVRILLECFLVILYHGPHKRNFQDLFV